ncbi:MAG: hypothetical protein ACUVQI_02770 [Thermochromatium sp.]
MSTPTPATNPTSVSRTDSSPETLSLSEQIKDQIEQEPDYQILRCAFALDVDGSKASELGRAAETAFGDQLESSSVQSISLAESFELQAVATHRCRPERALYPQ